MASFKELMQYGLLRLLATLADLLILILCFSLFVASTSLFTDLAATSLFTALTSLLCLGFLSLAMLACEAFFRFSPGKWAAGLELKLPETLPGQILSLLTRTLFKWGQIAFLFCLSPLGPKPLPEFWPLLSWLGWLWLFISQFLSLWATGTCLHDLASGSKVIPKQKQPGFLSSLILLGGISLTSMVLSPLLVIYGMRSQHNDGPAISSVKASMHTMQTMAETYAVDWGGVYPANVVALKTAGTFSSREYWKEFTNPFTGLSGIGKSYADIGPHPIPSKGLAHPKSKEAGLVIYDPVRNREGRLIKYFVYGLDKQGQIIQNKGQNLVLTNS